MDWIWIPVTLNGTTFLTLKNTSAFCVSFRFSFPFETTTRQQHQPESSEEEEEQQEQQQEEILVEYSQDMIGTGRGFVGGVRGTNVVVVDVRHCCWTVL